MHRSIAFVGPPGSGKGSQVTALQQFYPGRFFPASTGDILREEKEHPLVLAYQQREDRSALFSDEDMVQVLTDWLQRKAAAGLYAPYQQIVIKDGFPRTVPQVHLALQHFKWQALVSFTYVDEGLSVERVLGRRQKALVAGSAARNDDNECDARKRYRVFVDQTLPLIEEARTLGVPVYELDARRTIDAMSRDLQHIIAAYF